MTKKKKFLGVEGGIGTDNDGNLNIITDLSKPTDLVRRIKRGELKIVDDDGHVLSVEQVLSMKNTDDHA